MHHSNVGQPMSQMSPLSTKSMWPRHVGYYPNSDRVADRPQAQSLDACYLPDLQDNKPLTAKRMKGIGYLSRTQRLMA